MRDLKTTIQPPPTGEVADTMRICRVANGWIIQPGRGATEFTHIAATPDALAEHVKRWATIQVKV